jgi:toxin ParE1/3/4
MKVRWTRGARAHLRAIHDYIAADSKRHARRLVDRILRKTQLLEFHPRLGGEVPEYRDESIRELFHRSYRIVYRILPEQIDVIAVIHGARLLPDLPPSG